MAAMDDDRHAPFPDGSAACPFVALEDDRDRRLDRPDHRHRCFAELRPSQRALAHQQAYCLSTAFPACPTFVDWARREAAKVVPAAPFAGGGPEAGAGRQRNWAASPSWAAGAAAGALAGAADATGEPAEPAEPGPESDFVDDEAPEEALAPPFLAARARPSESSAPEPPPDAPPRDASPDSGFWGAAPDRDRPWESDEEDEGAWPPRGAAAVGAASTTRRSGPRPARPAGGQVHRESRLAEGPSWEQPRRVEAYPRLRSRLELPRLGGIWLAVVALLVAAAALFFLPTLLSPKGSGPGVAEGTPTPAPTASVAVSPTATPAPSQNVYVVKQGDTLSKIAAAYGLTIDQILAANHQIKDPNKIAIGDQIVIPTPAPSTLENATPGTSP